MILSIIIPAYNIEEYIEKCLDSALNQDIDDYEIVVVNDGSNDKTRTIVEKYKEKYNNKIKLINKKNGGLSSARNAGLQYSKGDYILFLDGDDSLEYNCLKKLLKSTDNKYYDIIIFDFILVYENKQIITHQTINNTREYVLANPNACNKLIKKSIFTENNLKFSEGIWFEDLELIPTLIKYTNKFKYINFPIYYYTQRSGSITNGQVYTNKLFDKIQSINSLKEILGKDYYEEVEYLCIIHVLYGLSIKLIKFKKIDGIVEVLKYCNTQFPNWDNNKYFLGRSLLFRLYCLLLKSGRFKIASLLCWLKERIKNDKNK